MPNHERSLPHPLSDVKPTAMPAKVTDGEHIATIHKHAESGTLFVQVNKGEVPIFTAALNKNGEVTTRVHVTDQAIDPEPTPLLPDESNTLLTFDMSPFDTDPSQPEPEPASNPEKEKPARLRGRIGTEIRRITSPTGGTMATFHFGEHPASAEWSYSNTLPEKPEKDTIWWPVAAFDERVELIANVQKGKAYDLTALKRSWKDKKDGKEKTVTGWYLLSIHEVTSHKNKRQK